MCGLLPLKSQECILNVHTESLIYIFLQRKQPTTLNNIRPRDFQQYFIILCTHSPWAKTFKRTKRVQPTGLASSPFQRSECYLAGEQSAYNWLMACKIPAQPPAKSHSKAFRHDTLAPSNSVDQHLPSV